MLLLFDTKALSPFTFQDMSFKAGRLGMIGKSINGSLKWDSLSSERDLDFLRDGESDAVASVIEEEISFLLLRLLFFGEADMLSRRTRKEPSWKSFKPLE